MTLSKDFYTKASPFDTEGYDIDILDIKWIFIVNCETTMIAKWRFKWTNGKKEWYGKLDKTISVY